MKKRLIGLVVFLIVIGYWLAIEGKSEGLGKVMVDDVGQKTKTEKQVSLDNEGYSAITKEFGAVEITIKPETLALDKKMVFEMAVNTHSADLGYDWKKVIELKDNLGNLYEVVDWDGGERGHHLKGRLVFAPLKNGGKELEVVVKEVEGVDDSFVWKIL